MNEWDETRDIKPDPKNDMLLNAFFYAVENQVDTVELEVEFTKGQKILGECKFQCVYEIL